MSVIDIASAAATATNALLPDLLDGIKTVVVGVVGTMLARYLGSASALVLQQQLDAVMQHAIGWAVPQVVDLINKQGWSVEIQNKTAALAAQYVVDHAPVLVGKIKPKLGQLEAKALARLSSHPDVKAAVAGLSPPEPSNDNAAASAAA